MNLVSAEDLSVNFGDRVLFEGINIGVNKGEKTGIVASNGSGKSTLLKILAREFEPNTGSVSWSKGTKVGFLSQNPQFDDELSIREQIRSANTEIMEAIAAYQDSLRKQQSDNSSVTLDMLNDATDNMDKLNAWDHERRLQELLSKFKITELDMKIGSLSGGQKKRLALAIVLLEEPDILLLDEPTNHLDVDMIEWLEEYLSSAKLSVLMVTHDRYFLDEVCNSIVEMHGGKIYKHQGNYAYYLEKKHERIENEQTQQDKDRKFLRTELEWIRRSPKARTGKSKSRINAFYDLKGKQSGKDASGRFNFGIKEERIGGKILELKRISKGYDSLKLIDKFDYVFKKGERIGIVGPNGSGKSTLLNIIMEQLEPDAGKVVKGETINFGYYQQDTLHFDPEKRTIDVVREVADVIEVSTGQKISAGQFLRHFEFNDHKQFTLIKNLSGGEKRRLHLILVLIANPNFLILDEPTNDLDLITLNKLEEFLMSFKGCLLMVSHDRYFLDKLSDHLFIFEGDGRIKDFNGSYSQYREEALAAKVKTGSSKADQSSDTAATRVQNRARKASYKEKREFEELEVEIEDLSREKQSLEEKLSKGDDNYEALAEIGVRLQEVNEMLDEKEFRWLELIEIIEP